MSVVVHVRSLAGELVCAIEADRSWTVQDLKLSIEALDGVPKARQRLIIGTSELRDMDSLATAFELGHRFSGAPVRFGTATVDNIVLDVNLIRISEQTIEWIRRVKQDGLDLRLAPASPRDCPIVTRAAVEQNGLALACASKELQRDRAMVLAAVQQNGMALMFASMELRADRAIVYAAACQNYASLSCASPALRSDPELKQLTVNRFIEGARGCCMGYPVNPAPPCDEGAIPRDETRSSTLGKVRALGRSALGALTRRLQQRGFTP